MAQTFRYCGAPCRLDKALEGFFPQLGLRGRRRLIAEGLVLAARRPRAAGYVVKDGTEITVLEESELPRVPSTAEQAELSASRSERSSDIPRLLKSAGELCFVYKPSAMHSVSLAGGRGESLESCLEHLLPPRGASSSAENTGPRLMQRLDYYTSGILTAALSPQAAAEWRAAEDAGQCRKRYIALVCGRLESETRVGSALNTAQRKKTRVLNTEAPKVRHTFFTPLARLDAESLNVCSTGKSAGGEGTQPHEISLVGCTIRKGARHQIRVHAASAGFPLLGDTLYDAPLALRGAEGEGRFFLHHGALLCPFASVTEAPHWQSLLPRFLLSTARKWLES